jgi:hypothetical protein
MGKYAQLERHLRAIDSGVRIDMTFDEVNRWVPGGLPPSAFRQKTWWANEASRNQVHAQAWVRTGWIVTSVDLTNRSVTFERVDAQTDDPKLLIESGETPSVMGSQPSNGTQSSNTTQPPNGTKPANGSKPSDEQAVDTPPTTPMEGLASLLSGGWVTGLVGDLENELEGADADSAMAAAADAGVTPRLLSEALMVRRHLGRLNDLIHATAITLALPRILEDGESVVSRPALETSGDRANGFDLVTDRRVANFQVGVWTGKDAIRKRMVFQDLVHLAAQHSGRRAELYVAGQAPLEFLRESRSPVSWALNFGPTPTRQLFVERFGDTNLPIHVFTRVAAAHVRIIDLTEVLPQVQTAVLSA